MAQLMLVNPRKRRRTTTKRKTTAVARRKSPVRRRRTVARPATRRVTRRRRNPIQRKGIMNQVQPAFVAASGALALDLAWGFLPIPANLQMGPLRYLAKGAGAIGIGILAGNVVNKKTAEQMATGALTVILHDAMREVTQTMVPTVPLGYYSGGQPVGEYVNGLNGMNEYMPGNMDPYLDQSLSTPFAGPSAIEQAENAARAECGDNW